jgi:hypothetical protein
VGHDRRVSNEVFHFRQDRWEPWSVPEIGWPKLRISAKADSESD